LFYCPEKIECERDSWSSCKMIGKDFFYWNMTTTNQNIIRRGTYKLYPTTPINGARYPGPSWYMCRYFHENPRESQTSIDITPHHFFIEAYFDKTTKWINDDQNKRASCINVTKNIDCPFILSSVVGLKGIYGNNNKFKFVIYGKEIKVNPAKSFDESFLSEVDLNRACSGAKECQIDIFQKDIIRGEEKIGSVMIDTFNRMKITKVINHIYDKKIEKAPLPYEFLYIHEK